MVITKRFQKDKLRDKASFEYKETQSRTNTKKKESVLELEYSTESKNCHETRRQIFNTPKAHPPAKMYEAPHKLNKHRKKKRSYQRRTTKL